MNKYYLTTPIYYVNAAPHIGHAYTTIVADLIKRFKRMQGYEAFLTTGSDEHGVNVERAAERAGKTPKEFCDVIAAEFRRSARERRAEQVIAGRRLLDSDDIDRLTAKIDASRRVRELHAELRALPESERAVLELVSVDGLTVAEAAAALNIKPVAARVRLHRARRALRATSPRSFQLAVETEVAP